MAKSIFDKQMKDPKFKAIYEEISAQMDIDEKKAKLRYKSKKCCICGKPVFSIKSIYCRTCSHFSARMSDERFPPKTREQLWNYVRKYGYVCYYTGQELDVFNESSAYFLEFDHVVPGNPDKIVITSAWFNEMKGDLTFKELKRSIVQLYNYWFKGIKIKKMKFRYWFRLHPPA